MVSNVNLHPYAKANRGLLYIDEAGRKRVKRDTTRELAIFIYLFILFYFIFLGGEGEVGVCGKKTKKKQNLLLLTLHPTRR